jgi:hypothetical protein
LRTAFLEWSATDGRWRRLMAVGDEYTYSTGRKYIETDHGPNVWTVCYTCDAPAACTFEIQVRDVRCGICMASDFEMLPGQYGYELKKAFVIRYPRVIDRIRALRTGANISAT